MRPFFCFSIFFAALLSGQTDLAIPVQHDDVTTKYDDWLIAEEQLYKIRVDVFLPDGQPANDFQVQFRLANQRVDQKSRVDGNRITAWLSVFDHGTLSELWINTNDGRFIKKLRFQGPDIRKSCANGVRADLVPVRRIRVHVVDHESNPIPNASLIGESVRTNGDGDAFVELPANETPIRFSVIAPNGEVGLLNLYDKPEKAKAGEFELKTIPHEGTVKQTIRLLDENGDPARYLAINPQPMDRTVTLVPEKGYPMRTDGNGEAQVTWIPGLPGPRAFIFVFESDWVVDSDERTPSLWTVNLRTIPRKPISGKVNLPEGIKGGFGIQLTSFDYPTEGRADQLYSRTDDQGNFVANVLPGVPYCVYVVDSQWSSSIWDGVLVEEDGTLNAPELNIERGLPVKIVATVGAGKSPMANTMISLARDHVFRTKTGNGSAGPRWWVTTNDEGVAQAFSASGPLEASIYSPNYNDSITIDVNKDGENEIRFHRKSVAMTTISGELVAKNGELDVGGATVIVHTIDGKSRFSTSGTTTDDGQFEMRGLGERFAVFAMSADKKAAGFAFVESEQAKSMEVDLQPTCSFRGRLIDTKGNPLKNCKVNMEVRLTDKAKAGLGVFAQTRMMTTLAETTNSNGEFEFKHVPTSVPVVVRIDDAQVPEEVDQYLGRYMVTANENRPLETFEIGRASRPTEPQSLETRLARLNLNCKINSANALILILGEGLQVDEFYQQAFSTQGNKDLYWYLPAAISYATSQRPDTKQSLADRKWELPKENQIAMIATDASGAELDRVTLDLSDKTAEQQVKDFVSKNKGETADAQAKLDAALDKASQTNRKVWVTIGHTRCAPCFRMGQWIDSQKSILEKEYVFVKVDVARDINAEEISKLITSGKHHGVPFYAILNADGSVLIDAEGPLGNIGFPGGSYEGRRHLETMLSESADRLTAEEIQALIQSLKRNR